MKLKMTTAAILFTLGVTLSGGAIAQQTPAAKPDAGSSSSSELKTRKGQSQLRHRRQHRKKPAATGIGIEVDPNLLLRGLNDQLSGGKLLLNEEETKAVLTTLQKEARAKKEAKMKALGEANQKEGEAYLAANKAKEGVVTLPSGVQYKVEKQGDGPKPTRHRYGRVQLSRHAHQRQGV